MSLFVISGSVLVLMVLCTPTMGQPVDKDAVRDVARKLIMDCQSKSGASDADLAAIIDHKLPETHAGLCLVECVLNTTSIMQNGKYSKSGFVDAFQPLLENDQHKESLEKMSTTCEKEVGNGDEDKCLTAKLIAECIVKHGKTHGFDLPASSKN